MLNPPIYLGIFIYLHSICAQVNGTKQMKKKQKTKKIFKVKKDNKNALRFDLSFLFG